MSDPRIMGEKDDLENLVNDFIKKRSIKLRDRYEWDVIHSVSHMIVGGRAHGDVGVVSYCIGVCGGVLADWGWIIIMISICPK